MKKKLAVFIFLGLMLCLGGYFYWNQQKHSVQPGNTEHTVEKMKKKNAAEEEQPVNPVLTKKLNKIKSQDAADIEIYADYGDGNQPVLINSHKVRSASMIKVFILAKAMEEEKAGHLDLNETVVLNRAMKVGGSGSLIGWRNGTAISIRTLLEKMITESDNTATNMMIDRLGLESINSYIRSGGYGDTILQRKMMDTEAIRAGRENYTSARDLGRFFSLLYRGKCVSPSADEKMRNLLLRQEDTECFPAALPDCRIAHKTGELDRLYHDGGIIYSPQGDFVLVVLSENQNNRGATLQHMREIAKTVKEEIPKH